MNKGFTLIELLAVIVILAIIALIATPIVLSIINDTKQSSLLRSADFFIDSVQNAIVQENMVRGGTLNPKECVIDTSGKVLCDNVLLDVEIDGQKPSDGSIILDSGQVIEANLVFLDKIATLDNKGQLVFEDKLPICRLLKGNKNTIGSKYECEVKEGLKYNFYILSKEPNGTTNLIMERNICQDGNIATSNNTCLVKWNSNGNSAEGPVTAMQYLNNATSTWDNIPNLNISYDDEDKNFVGFLITGKARMPRYDEVHASDKCLTRAENNDQYGSCPLWLVNYLNVSDYYSAEQGKVDVGGIWGYWTLSSYSGFNNSALHVHYYGDVGGYSVELDNHLGVRPVINLKI